jgi:hypothetical protein
MEAVDKPKRKRRTKAEMEAARIAAEKPKRKRNGTAKWGRPPKGGFPIVEKERGDSGEFFEAWMTCTTLPNQRLCYVRKATDDGMGDQVLCRRKPGSFRLGQRVIVRILGEDLPEVLRQA